KFNRYSFFKTPKVLLLACDRVFKIKDAFGNKQYKPEDIQELFHELFNDVQNIHEELAEYINTAGWNRPAFYNNGDDDDEESNEFIKSSVETLVPNPSEFEDECECDVPDCDDSQTTNFSTFSNPLFDDSTSSDFESSHEEVIYEMSLKTYSNPLFDLNEEIISNEFNLIHNKDFNSTPKNDRFDAESYPLESLLNHNTLMASSLKIISNEFNLIHNKDFNSTPKNDRFDAESYPLESLLNHNTLMASSLKIDSLLELLDNYSLSLPENKSFHFDIPSFSRPPAKPPDGNTGILNIKMMGDNSKQKVPMPGLMITLVSNQEKSPDLLTHRSLENFQLFAKCPMMIH
nr:hypothetical protein [Tanacetum cinerariifolium]